MSEHEIMTAEALADVSAALDDGGDAMVEDAIGRANVRGLGIGIKHVDGRPTGEPALIALVSQKLPLEALDAADRLPAKLGGMPTDIIEIGEPSAGFDTELPGLEPPSVQLLGQRKRPVEGGYSIGHFRGGTGTLATAAIDRGALVPKRYFALSNNHVLANSNAARIGDPIVQPGRVDGGTYPADAIGRLARFVPIQFHPAVPLARHRNLVDAALAEVPMEDLDREVYWIGYPDGSLPARMIRPGMRVRKTGRTTDYTRGAVQAVRATVDVNYGAGRIARFREQVVTTPMSAPGDSGSLVVDDRNRLVGLLFAGSSRSTIFNPIEFVTRLLAIEL